jgi:hypothetical protein
VASLYNRLPTKANKDNDPFRLDTPAFNFGGNRLTNVATRLHVRHMFQMTYVNIIVDLSLRLFFLITSFVVCRTVRAGKNHSDYLRSFGGPAETRRCATPVYLYVQSVPK